MSKPTFEQIKEHARSDAEPVPRTRIEDLRIAARAMDDRDALIEMVEALRHVAHPVGATVDMTPLVLYFENEQDRQGFVEVCREINPNWRAVKVP